MNILLTGAAGTLGSSLLPELLKDGHEVTALIHQAPLSQDGIAVVRGDTTLPGFGIESNIPHFDAIVHCAGVVSFKDRPELHLANVVGADNAANLAVQLGATLFHISTAYVCGNYTRGVRVPSELISAQLFRNPYEQSKFTAELNIRNRPGLKYTVIRPSILVGDSTIGGVQPMSGFFVVVRGLYLGKRWLERTMGLPQIEPHLRLKGDPKATINLIPVDTAARQIADIVKADARGTYYVVNERPPLLKELAAAASRVLSARVEIVPDLEPNPAERIVMRLVRDIAPYMAGEPAFDNSATRPLTQARCEFLTPAFMEATIRRFLGEIESVSGIG